MARRTRFGPALRGPALRGVVAAVTGIVLLASAAAAAVAETRVALVVGNGAYAHTTVLSNPANDASDIAAALEKSGFTVVKAIDVGRRDFDGALRRFTELLSGADVALFYYAGHGLQVGLQNYLVPVDAQLARERDLEFEAVSLAFVLRQMEIDREGKTTIVMLDACRDNPLARNLARSMGTRSTNVGRGLAPAATGLGTFIAYATQPGNVALDGTGRNSPFTAALLSHMGQRGRNLNATMIAVRKDVIAATDGRQVPWDHSAMTGEFFFVPGDAGPARGDVVAAPAAAPDDIAAMKQRLARLEAEAGSRTANGAPAEPMTSADAIRLAELRARSANLDDQVQELRRRLTEKSMEQGRASDPQERRRLQREVSTVMMDWTRHGLELKKARDEIAALEAKVLPGERAREGRPPRAEVAGIPPVTPRAAASAAADSFESADNVRLEGTEIRSFRAPSPDACRNACADEDGCVGYQHGRRIGVMGQCVLFASVAGRHEDRRWRSGMRAPSHSAVLLPPELLGRKPSRVERGFKVFQGASLEGDVIKMTSADSTRSCMTVCRNTAGCNAAVFLDKMGELGNMCTTYGRVTRANTDRFGASALFRD